MTERIFPGFLFLSRRILPRILSPDFFLLIFVGKVAQINPPAKVPAKSSKNYTRKMADIFLLRVRANKSCLSISLVEVFFDLFWALFCLWFVFFRLVYHFCKGIVRAACLQNETAPEKTFKSIRNNGLKNAKKRSEKRSKTRLKSF